MGCDKSSPSSNMAPRTAAAIAPQVPRTAADAIIIRPAKYGDFQILLIRRREDTYKLAFPGGHIDNNEDPKGACVREL